VCAREEAKRSCSKEKQTEQTTTNNHKENGRHAELQWMYRIRVVTNLYFFFVVKLKTNS
jgi:hypothetical protein